MLQRLSLLLMLILLLSSCRQPAAIRESVRTLTVLYTNDEHGWMAGMQPGQGAAELYGLWQEQEGFSENGSFLVLSGGDNFTGPAISTWTAGASMVEVMNAMSYDASAIGNHEFDFGLPALQARIQEANYEYLSANILWQSDNRIPTELGIQPYTIKEVNDLRVAIIGLTTTDTPVTSNPTYVRELNFIDYEGAVRQTVAAMADESYDLLFVIAHVCMNELLPLAESIQDLHVSMFGGGHCNELLAKETAGAVILGGGFHFSAYAKAEFHYDLEQQALVAVSYSSHNNQQGNADSAVAALIEHWSDQAGDALNEVLAHSERDIVGQALGQMIINTWLEQDNSADIAITNAGGIRTTLAAGDISLDDVVSMLPFDNTIIRVRVPGSALITALQQGGRPIVAGAELINGQWRYVKTGKPFAANKRYTVLLNSFMYAGGDNFGALAAADPQGFDTGLNYREPFVQWLRKNQL